jgi:hypothetical protein
MNGGGGKRDLRDVGVKEKEATLTIRKAAVIYVMECATE